MRPRVILFNRRARGLRNLLLRRLRGISTSTTPTYIYIYKKKLCTSRGH